MNQTSEKKAFDFQVRISDDRLAVVFDGVVPGDDKEEFAEALVEQLRTLKVADIPEKSALLELLSNAPVDEGGRITNLALIAGKAPIPPKDGRIEWARDFFSSDFVIDEKTGAIDYREHTGDPSVVEDEFIARIHPPEDGEDGRDVLGKRLSAGKGKPVRIRLLANVKSSEDGSELFAKKRGRLRYVKHTLSVDPVYVIEGDVGLESGNIEHSGALFVEGDVQVGSHIRADGDVEIAGIVESADIEAGGNLIVRRGITGGEGHQIKIGGRVRVRFLVETEIHAGDDVVVESEMVNSNVITRGSFIMPGGRLVGGSVTAQGNIHVRQAGSEGTVPTRLDIELDPALARAIAEKESEMKRLRDNLQKIKNTLASIKNKKNTLGEEARGALAKLVGSVSDMQATLHTLESERQELIGEMHNRGRPQIIIQGVAYPETMLDIYTHRMRVREPIVGPVRAVTGKNGLEFQPVSAPPSRSRS
ncbi:MAG: FapA family protein [Candidatus Hydrogenedentota bacterium]